MDRDTFYQRSIFVDSIFALGQLLLNQNELYFRQKISYYIQIETL
jgi:hypothetical protein